MKSIRKASVLFFTVMFVASTLSCAALYRPKVEYKVKKQHMGGDVSPTVAYEMLKKDPKHVILVDVRTRAEYQLIGHPEGAYNIPLKFWTGKMGEKNYTKSTNPRFGEDLKALFNPQTDTLLFMCRSGKRSCSACNEAVKAGWPEDRVFNLMGGFEGDKVKDKNSPYYGQRKLGGWRNEGLPWSYHVDKHLIYQRDLAA
jgi:rhodanese-related sulfurtransferase